MFLTRSIERQNIVWNRAGSRSGSQQPSPPKGVRRVEWPFWPGSSGAVTTLLPAHLFILRGLGARARLPGGAPAVLVSRYCRDFEGPSDRNISLLASTGKLLVR